MKFILEFNSYKNPTYEVGDIVLVEYWYLIVSKSCIVNLDPTNLDIIHS